MLKKEHTMSSNEVLKDFFSGVCSGSVASLAGQPLDTVRVRTQARGSIGFHGLVGSLKKTWRGEVRLPDVGQIAMYATR